MYENYNTNMIDPSAVKLVISKLELYIENEEKNINNIVLALEQLDESYYSSDNKPFIDKKITNLTESLYTNLEQKKKIKEYLKEVVIRNVRINENNANQYILK